MPKAPLQGAKAIIAFNSRLPTHIGYVLQYQGAKGKLDLILNPPRAIVVSEGEFEQYANNTLMRKDFGIEGLGTLYQYSGPDNVLYEYFIEACIPPADVRKNAHNSAAQLSQQFVLFFRSTHGYRVNCSVHIITEQERALLLPPGEPPP